MSNSLKKQAATMSSAACKYFFYFFNKFFVYICLENLLLFSFDYLLVI